MGIMELVCVTKFQLQRWAGGQVAEKKTTRWALKHETSRLGIARSRAPGTPKCVHGRPLLAQSIFIAARQHAGISLASRPPRSSGASSLCPWSATPPSKLILSCRRRPRAAPDAKCPFWFMALAAAPRIIWLADGDYRADYSCLTLGWEGSWLPLVARRQNSCAPGSALSLFCCIINLWLGQQTLIFTYVSYQLQISVSIRRHNKYQDKPSEILKWLKLIQTV